MKEKKFIMNYSPMEGVQSHNEPRERHLKPLKMTSKPRYSWFNYLQPLIFQVVLWLETLETQRITGTVEQIIESE